MELKKLGIDFFRSVLNLLLRSLTLIDSGLYFAITFVSPAKTEDTFVVGNGSSKKLTAALGLSSTSPQLATPLPLADETITEKKDETPNGSQSKAETPASQRRVKLMLDLSVDGDNVEIVSATRMPLKAEPSFIAQSVLAALNVFVSFTAWTRDAIETMLKAPLLNKDCVNSGTGNGISPKTGVQGRLMKSPRKRIKRFRPNRPLLVMTWLLEYLGLRQPTPGYPRTNTVFDLLNEDVLQRLSEEQLRKQRGGSVEKRKYDSEDEDSDDSSTPSREADDGASGSSEYYAFTKGKSAVPAKGANRRPLKTNELLKNLEDGENSTDDPDYEPSPEEIAASLVTETSSSSGETESIPDTENLNVSDSKNAIENEANGKEEEHEPNKNPVPDIDVSSVEYAEEALTRSTSSSTGGPIPQIKVTNGNSKSDSQSGGKSSSQSQPAKTEVGRAKSYPAGCLEGKDPDSPVGFQPFKNETEYSTPISQRGGSDLGISDESPFPDPPYSV